MSIAELPRNKPVSPPEMNSDTNPIAKSIGGLNRIFPRHIVVSQLNTFTAEGTAISNVSNTKIDPRNGLIPVTNIWCAHTRKASSVIPINEMIIAK